MKIPSRTLWTVPSPSVVLEPRTAHLWRACREGRFPGDWLKFLCPAERERAERFHFDQHRERFVVFRGILRTILGQYLGQSPDEVCFAYESGGKPLLTVAPKDFCFNLTHSHDWMVLACGWGQGIGVDIERQDPRLQAEAIAQRYFTAAEHDKIRALSGGAHLEAFFQIWTEREAVLKAEGMGLADLQRVPVLAEAWQAIPFVPAPGYAGCLAMAKDCRVTGYFDFPGN